MRAALKILSNLSLALLFLLAAFGCAGLIGYWYAPDMYEFGAEDARFLYLTKMHFFATLIGTIVGAPVALVLPKIIRSIGVVLLVRLMLLLGSVALTWLI